MCLKTRILRVLNAIRKDDIGMPLTIDQFHHLKPTVVLDRLVFRKHYGLAIQIAKHLTLPETRILEHWAYHKIMNEPSKLQSELEERTIFILITNYFQMSVKS